MIEKPSLGEYGVRFPRHIGSTLTEKLVIGGIFAASASRLVPYVFSGLETRGQLPDIIDIPNHIGNLSVSYAILYEVNKSLWSRKPQLEKPEGQRKLGKFIAASTAIVTVLANAYAEKYGYTTLNVPDPLDFVYGCVGGYIGYKFAKPWYYTPGEVRERDENRPDGPVARTVRRLKQEREPETIPLHEARSGRPHKSKNNLPGIKEVRKRQRQARRRNR